MLYKTAWANLAFTQTQPQHKCAFNPSMLSNPSHENQGFNSGPIYSHYITRHPREMHLWMNEQVVYSFFQHKMKFSWTVGTSSYLGLGDQKIIPLSSFCPVCLLRREGRQVQSIMPKRIPQRTWPGEGCGDCWFLHWRRELHLSFQCNKKGGECKTQGPLQWVKAGISDVLSVCALGLVV
jgi:hypothetical protein